MAEKTEKQTKLEPVKPEQVKPGEATAADIIENRVAEVAVSGELADKKLAQFLNEFANTPARAKAMQKELAEGIAPDAFVDKFFPQNRRAKYIAKRVKDVQ